MAEARGFGFGIRPSEVFLDPSVLPEGENEMNRRRP